MKQGTVRTNFISFLGRESTEKQILGKGSLVFELTFVKQGTVRTNFLLLPGREGTTKQFGKRSLVFELTFVKQD